jgi:hypothetical protein
MDCYRQLAEDKMAETLADEVILSSTDFDGTERAPMRTAEARVTLGVRAAREGDIEQAVHQGERALSGPRQSLPTLAMVSRDLARIHKDRYPASRLPSPTSTTSAPSSAQATYRGASLNEPHDQRCTRRPGQHAAGTLSAVLRLPSCRPV